MNTPEDRAKEIDKITKARAEVMSSCNDGKMGMIDALKEIDRLDDLKWEIINQITSTLDSEK